MRKKDADEKNWRTPTAEIKLGLSEKANKILNFLSECFMLCFTSLKLRRECLNDEDLRNKILLFWEETGFRLKLLKSEYDT
jgi:hypothetical protein